MKRALIALVLAHAFVVGCSGGGGGGPSFEIPDGDFGDFGSNDDTGSTNVDGGGGDSGATPTFEQFPVGPQLADLAVDPSGNLWATTELGGASGSAKIHRFTPSTKTLDSFDVSGGSDAIGTEGGLAIDGSGNVWVTTYGAGTTPGDRGYALVKVSPSGSVLARYTDTSSLATCPDNPCAQNPFLGQAGSPAIDPSGNVWLADPGIASKTFFLEMSPSGTLVRYGTLSSAAHAPTVLSVAIDGAGNLWGSDPNENLIVKVAPDGSIAGKFPVSDKTDGANARFAFDRSGNVWVAGSEEAFTPGELIVMTPDGSVTKKIPIPDGGSADALAIDAAGLVWVIDDGMQNVYAFDGSGAVVKKFPFPNLTNIGVTQGMQRSFVIDPSGNLWWATGQPGLGPDLQGQLVRVAGVATGPQYFPYSAARYPY